MEVSEIGPGVFAPNRGRMFSMSGEIPPGYGYAPGRNGTRKRPVGDSTSWPERCLGAGGDSEIFDTKKQEGVKDNGTNKRRIASLYHRHEPECQQHYEFAHQYLIGSGAQPH